ncbi:E3 ubiquitin-protein ligase UPL5-like [Solanum tuberosum]|uniref:E3 ubiquitin-protein ligase UPL5-like n=1 Tax=Solanum tuberosum TaxID=4113 RepID=UPI00073A0222|nr:PREDICTED: E3 ubiquitin-protein ligase UPL5-like [Solanum tuberosum]
MESYYVCSASDLKDMGMLVRQFTDKACNHIHLFISSPAPTNLVMLYLSPDNAKRHVADESIRRFINSLMSTDLHMKRYSECARFILVFCKLLRRVVGLEDLLYRFCRSSIREIIEVVGIAGCKKNVANELLALNDAFIFVHEVVVADLFRELELSMGSIEFTGLSLMSIVRDFTEYTYLVRALMQQPFDGPSDEAVYDREYIESLHHILSDLHIVLYDLLDKIERCLRKLEDQLRLINEDGRLIVSWLSQYLVILKEFNNISKLFNNSEVFWQKLSKRKFSLCFLIEMFAKSFEDYRWIIEHKEVTNYKVQRDFTMMLLEKARGGNKKETYEMLMDRSMLLDISFEFIVDQDPALLRGDLLMQFKHEEAIGPGVLIEWFFLLAGDEISLEDIRDADPSLYSS